MMALLVLAVIVRALWAYDMRRRMDALVTDCHAKGLPILQSDFVVPVAEGTDELVRDYKETIAPLRTSSAFSSSTRDVAAAKLNTARYDHAGQLARALRRKGASGWGGTKTSDGNTFHLFRGSKYLSADLGDRASDDFSAGHEVEGIEKLRDILHVEHMVVANLSGWEDSIVQPSWTTMRPIRLLTRDEPKRPCDPKIRKAILELIQELLNEDKYKADARRCILGNCASELALAMNVDASYDISVMDQTSDFQEFRMVFPAAQQRMISSTKAGLAALNCIEGPSDPMALFTLPAAAGPAPMTQIEREVCQRTSFIDSATVYHWGQRYFQDVANRRIEAMLLALHLYSGDHVGRLPESLNELAPGYLPAVPVDPYAPDGASFRYLPAGPHPLLLSNGASEASTEYWGEKAGGPPPAVWGPPFVVRLRPAAE